MNNYFYKQFNNRNIKTWPGSEFTYNRKVIESLVFIVDVATEKMVPSNKLNKFYLKNWNN